MKSSPDKATSGASTRRGDPRRVAGLLLVALVTLAGASLLLEAVTNRTEPVGAPPPPPETAPPWVDRDLSRAALPPGIPGPGSTDFEELVRQKLAKVDDADSEADETADDDADDSDSEKQSADDEAEKKKDKEEEEDDKSDGDKGDSGKGDDKDDKDDKADDDSNDRDQQDGDDEEQEETGEDEDAASPGAGMSRSMPTAVRIPELSVDAKVTGLDPDEQEALDPPTEAGVAGWYEAGPSPGETGTAVLLGRAGTGVDPGVFADIGSLTSGDEIEIDREDGDVARFVVERVGRYPTADFLAALIAGAADQSGLRLISCGDGPGEVEADSCYPEVIIFANLAESQQTD